MGVAVGLAWRGRSRWEPSEEDIDKGPQKIAGLGTAVFVGILWVLTRQQTSTGLMPGIAILAFILCFVSLLVYGFVTSTQTYLDGNKKRLIGGFTLTREARRTKSQKKIRTVQQLFAGAAYDPDEIWPRPSRALAKLTFVALYVVLIIAGSVAIASTAIAVEKATAPAPPPKPTVSDRMLRWISAPDADDILDGTAVQSGKRVWLRELFPSTPPISFQVRENVPTWLPDDAKEALNSVRLPAFAPILDGNRATSDAAWKLPDGIPVYGARTFVFVDANPEGTDVTSGTVTSGDVAISDPPTTACSSRGADGSYSATAGEATCVALAVTATVDPTLDITPLVPWGVGDTNLQTGLGAALVEVDRQVRREGGVGFEPQRAIDEFVRAHANELPGLAPEGWTISAPASIDVAPGETAAVRLEVVTSAPATVLVAMRFTDRASGASYLSPVLPIQAAPGQVTEPPSIASAPPSIATEPPSLGNQPPTITRVFTDTAGREDIPSYDLYDEASRRWYFDVMVQALVEDLEDGNIAGDAVTWTTDQTDIQPAELLVGDYGIFRLFAESCSSVRTHTITVTGRDSQGLTASSAVAFPAGGKCPSWYR